MGLELPLEDFSGRRLLGKGAFRRKDQKKPDENDSRQTFFHIAPPIFAARGGRFSSGRTAIEKRPFPSGAVYSFENKEQILISDKEERASRFPFKGATDF